MIPPSPVQFALWGSALYTELAGGLWLALAAPWLQPGWPASACVSDRQRTPDPGPATRPAAAAAAARARPAVLANGSDEPDPAAPAAPAAEGRVIEVPRGRWQRRRANGATTLPSER